MEDKSGLYVLAIVGIVAVIGLVVLMVGHETGITTGSSDSAGAAYWKGPPINYGYAAAAVVCTNGRYYINQTLTLLNMTNGQVSCATYGDTVSIATNYGTNKFCKYFGNYTFLSATPTNYGCIITDLS